MPDFSPHQQRIINRYYDQRDVIMLTKLQELSTELYLAETDKKRDNLWKRVEKAMTQLKVPPNLAAHILEKRDPAVLASNVADWLKQTPGGKGNSGTRPRAE